MAEPTPSVNSWLEEELYQQYKHDKKTVDPGWTSVFESNGQNGHAPTPSDRPVTALTVPVPAPAPQVPLSPGDELIPLRGPAVRIAENMTASLSIPIATSQRVIAVKVIDENRRIDQRAPDRRVARARFPTRTSLRGRS